MTPSQARWQGFCPGDVAAEFADRYDRDREKSLDVSDRMEAGRVVDYESVGGTETCVENSKF